MSDLDTTFIFNSKNGNIPECTNFKYLLQKLDYAVAALNIKCIKLGKEKDELFQSIKNIEAKPFLIRIFIFIDPIYCEYSSVSYDLFCHQEKLDKICELKKFIIEFSPNEIVLTNSMLSLISHWGKVPDK